MQKRVFIINGSGGVGKDTVCAIAADHFKVCNVSSITPIVEIAKFAGWNGEKTAQARRLLSRLKEAFTEFNDLSFQYCLNQYRDFCLSDNDMLFIHIREPKEIERIKQAIGKHCYTLLIRRPSLTQNRVLGNHSDDDVELFTYDYILENDGDLSTLRQKVAQFFSSILNSPLT